MEMVELPMLGKVKRYHIEKLKSTKISTSIFGTEVHLGVKLKYQIRFVLMGIYPHFDDSQKSFIKIQKLNMHI